MTLLTRQLRGIFAWVAIVIFALLFLALSSAYLLVRGSLPQLTGQARLPGLVRAVTVERDHLGIPTIQADSHIDLVRALGFIHAQDRFFQMDLLRRNAAGELSELFGKVTVDFDRTRRVHGLRVLANTRLASITPEEREVLEAYAAGVNRGIQALKIRPFEYLLLRTKPEPWRAEDSLLIIYAMFLDLQDDSGKRDRDLWIMHNHLPEEVFRFFTKNGSKWEAPLDNSFRPLIDIPGPSEFRYLGKGSRAFGDRKPHVPKKRELSEHSVWTPVQFDGLNPGSNAWALSGNRTKHSGALIANDMHLTLSVPNIWYRASSDYAGSTPNHDAVPISNSSKDLNPTLTRVYGITLPGVPAMIVGSNTKVAWGFTNAKVDTTDLIEIISIKNNPEYYAAPDGPLRLEKRMETIRVKGAAPVRFEVHSTIWGPIITAPGKEPVFAVRWIAHLPEAVNLLALELESANTVEKVAEIANKAGMPVQNIVFADSRGRIGWTLMGKYPRRESNRSLNPISSSESPNTWERPMDATHYPIISDPIDGQIWSANNRHVGGAASFHIGDGKFAWASRAYQIRKQLRNSKEATEEDMLAIQLDDSAHFLKRWRTLLLELLHDDGAEPDEWRRELKSLVQNWGGRASADSAGYRFVREFRALTADRVLRRLLSPCYEADEEFHHSSISYEEPLWLIVSTQPDHLINPDYGSWRAELRAIIDSLLEPYRETGNPLHEQTWGARNTVAIRHPLSRALPILSRWLDMPSDSISGDSYMPKVIRPTYGASVRMVVSPGKEDHGILHMPAGQSGHPLSPHYRDSHPAWVTGQPTAFLPGAPVNSLTLLPQP